MNSAPPPAKPEIDPELEAMEAEMAANGPKTLAQKLVGAAATLMRGDSKGKKSKGPTGNRGNPNDQRHLMSEGRMAARAAKRMEGVDRSRSPHARLGRAKPVKSPEQREREYRRAMEAELKSINLTRLVKDCPEMKFVIGVPGMKNVWQLSQAPTEWVHAIPGLGAARRKKIRAYLVKQNVPVVWAA